MVDSKINGKIICGYSQENLKNYQVKAGERIILAIDSNAKIDKHAIWNAKFELGREAFVQNVSLDLGQQQEDKLKLENNTSIDNALNPVIELMQQYSKEEIGIIIKHERFGKEQTDIDAYIQASSTIEQDIQVFKPDYKIESIKNKLLILKDRTRNELLLHEQYKLFRPHILQNMQDLNKLKGQCKSLPEYLSVSAQEKDFCINMYEKHAKAARLFDQEHQYILGQKYRLYSKNPDIFNDVTKCYNDALQLKACGTSLLDFEIIRKNQSLDMACESISKIIRDKLTYRIISDCGDLNKFGFIVHNDIKYTSKLDYLEGLATDPMINAYAGRLIQGEITDIKQDQMQQQAIEQEELARETKQHEALTQQETERQDTKEQEREQNNIVKDRSRGFGLGD